MEIAADKVLRDVIKHLISLISPKYDGYECLFASMVSKYFDKQSSSSNTSEGAVKSEIIPNQRPSELATPKLAEDLHKENLKNEKYTHLLKTIFGC